MVDIAIAKLEELCIRSLLSGHGCGSKPDCLAHLVVGTGSQSFHCLQHLLDLGITRDLRFDVGPGFRGILGFHM